VLAVVVVDGESAPLARVPDDRLRIPSVEALDAGRELVQRWSVGAVQHLYASVMEGPMNQYHCDSFTSMGASFDHSIFDSNQLTPTPCGTTNSTGNDPNKLYTNLNEPNKLYANPSNYDFTQQSGSPAIDFIPAGVSYPPADVVGEPRPNTPPSTQAHTNTPKTATRASGHDTGVAQSLLNERPGFGMARQPVFPRVWMVFAGRSGA
jgi:hypothetical protein